MDYISNRSPEPSPHGPPPPHPFQDSSIHTPLNDDETLPSVPDAPSPMSLPPGSVFSGELPNTTKKRSRSRRPPLQEVRLTSDTANGGRQEQGTATLEGPTDPLIGQEILRTSSRDTPVSNLDPRISDIRHSTAAATMGLHRMDASEHSSGYQSRSHLLPAVVSLKRDLQATHQSMFVLQEENKALAAECDRFAAELEQWQSHSEASHRTAQQRERKLQRDLQSLQSEYKVLEEDNRLSTEQYHKQVLSLQERLAEQASNAEALHLLQSEKAQLTRSHESSTSRWQSSLKSVREENELILSNLREAQARLSEVEHVEKDNVKLAEESKKQKKDLQNQLQQMSSLEDDLRKTREAYKDKLKKLKAENSELTEKLAEASRAPFDESDKTALELEECLKKASGEKASLENRLEECREKFASMEKKYQVLEKQLDEAQAELKRTKASLKKEATAKKAASVGDSSRKTMTSLQLEIDRQQAILKETKRASKQELASKENELANLRSEHQVLKDLLEQSKRAQNSSEQSCTDVGVQTDFAGAADPLVEPPDVPWIPNVQSYHTAPVSVTLEFSERLGRIRDAAERAQHELKYRRELSRIRAEHEAQMKSLSENHDKILKQVTQDAKYELNNKARDYKRRIQCEYEAEIEELGRKHDDEVMQVKARLEEEIQDAERSVEETSLQLVSTTRELEKEVQVRMVLEAQVADLREKVSRMQNGQSSLRNDQEVLRMKKVWEDDLVATLAAVQKECNDIFDRQVEKHTPSTETNCLAGASLGIGSQTLNLQDKIIGVPQTSSIWREKPSAYIDIDRALDETEAIVRSLTGVDVSA